MVKLDSEELHVWAPLSPAANKVGWGNSNSQRVKIFKKGKKRKRKKKDQTPATSTVTLNAPIKVDESESKKTKQKRGKEIQDPVTFDLTLDTVTEVDESKSKKNTDFSINEEQHDLPKGYNWNQSEGILVVEEAKKQSLFLQGNALIKLMEGSLCLSGYNVRIGSEVNVNYPSWSHLIELSTFGDTKIMLTSLPKGKELTFKFCSSHEGNPIVICNSWKSTCDTILSSRSNSSTKQSSKTTSRILICGGKSIGKSSMLRYLINRFITDQVSVALLDCDVGKPEFSPPGMLTLTIVNDPILSPLHLHVKKRHLGSFFFGSTNSRNNPTTYLEMISDLLSFYTLYIEEHCSGDERKMPLIINTDGWIKGFGFEILTTLVQNIRPTFVLQLTSNLPSKSLCLDPILPKESTLLSIKGYATSDDKLIPTHLLQNLKISTYFLEDDTIWDRVKIDATRMIADYECEIAKTLSKKKPYLVSLESVKCELAGQPVNERNLDVINSSIVGLVIRQKERRHPLCVGLGIIRGIDKKNSTLYVLSPVLQKELMLVDTIIGSESLSLPVECIHLGKYSEAFPYLCCRTKATGVGGSLMKSRKNIIRKSQGFRK
mmetsp:Transcript_37938/g.43333  ORF Transcript_37938/g.43333 Transcript_37938/m.43333 type:complete len:602 (+) Transcript_37938:112-1917(+)